MNMNLAAYNTWVELFDEDVSEMWRFERYELQKIGMLMTALRKELTNVYNNVESDLKTIRHQLEHKDALEKIKSSTGDKQILPGINDKENVDMPIAKKELNATLDSPDLFKVVDLNISNSSSTIIDLSFSDDNLAISKTDCSPPLNKRKKKFKHNKITRKSDNNIEEGLGFRRDIFNPRKSDADESVIAGTPEVSSKQVTSLVSSKTLRKVRKKKNATLTQMYHRASNEPSKIDADDGVDSDETRIDDKATQSFTDLLNCMNENAEKSDIADIQLENDAFSSGAHLNDSDFASPRNNAFSNAALLNDSDIASPQEVPIKKQKTEAEPVVRGKARKLLSGFSCQRCRDFYSNMNLTPEELQKKMDACSRHRYVYKPPPDTMPGFWDLTLTTQKVTENDSH